MYDLKANSERIYPHKKLNWMEYNKKNLIPRNKPDNTYEQKII